jgi:hypothetical protein
MHKKWSMISASRLGPAIGSGIDHALSLLSDHPVRATMPDYDAIPGTIKPPMTQLSQDPEHLLP